MQPDLDVCGAAHCTGLAFPAGRSSAAASRRGFLKSMALGGAGAWLTPLAERLARAAEASPDKAPARSLIVLWLQGGPSQLETFDPHPGSNIAAGSKARATRIPGVQLAEGLEQVADLMDKISLVRSVVSKEGDHERATYNVKTGFRPNPTIVHPSIGAVCCHQLPDNLEIPRHVSILPGQWPAKGGYLGAKHDAFKVGDPRRPIQDVISPVEPSRFQRRLADLDIVEAEFATGRPADLDETRLRHRASMEAALKMMSSEQLVAFDINQEPQSVLEPYGDTPFGRGCLAAVRLIEAGVRCVEVTLGGWDSHINNHELQARGVSTLDPAFAALIRDLERRELLDSTVVLCGGEFGRTPRINPTGGRDHWPHGFSVALAGGGIPGGQVVGATSPEPNLEVKDKTTNVEQPVQVQDVHATILQALGVNFREELATPVGRPMVISEGEPLFGG
ncbi:MAG: DUF1501 domain-containing protein [Planctomycetales bacterium]|nr:DUF1501 domain-containing protein [Planctomycetales bacterium]